MKKPLYLLIGLFLLTPSKAFVGAKATPPLPTNLGSFASSVTLKEESPLLVSSAHIQFDLYDKPLEEQLAMEQYSNKVTSTYTLMNPTEDPVTSTLIFPLGVQAEYLSDDDYALVKNQYSVKVDNIESDAVLRHTLKQNASTFDFDTVFQKMGETKVEDEYFNNDLAVIRYAISVNSANNDIPSSVRMRIPKTYSGLILADDFMYYNTWDSYYEMKFNVGAGDLFHLYLLGTDIPNISDLVYLYENQYENTLVPIVSRQAIRTELVFDDVMMRYHEDNPHVSEVDYYNAAIELLNLQFRQNTNIAYKIARIQILDLASQLDAWCEYEITVPAGQSVTNEVSVFIFPTVQVGYRPYVFDYEYLLTPAYRFNGFNDLTIDIKTDLKLIDSMLAGFEETNTGYRLELDQLPAYDLTFSLCESESPERINMGTTMVVGILLGIIASIGVLIFPTIIAIVIAGLLILVIYLATKKKKSS